MPVGVIARTNKRSGPREHGTQAKYVFEKCRCEACRKTCSEAAKLRARFKAYGRYRVYTDAEIARNRIAYLQACGLRLKEDVSARTGLSPTTLGEIKSGQRKRVTLETERRLLALSTRQERGGSYVPAPKVWALVWQIMAYGYSRAWLARRLGQKGPCLQLGTKKVKRSTLLKLQLILVWAQENPAPGSPQCSRSINTAARKLRKAKWLLEGFGPEEAARLAETEAMG